MRNSFPAHFAAALLVLACCALPLAAQDPRLQGKVVPAESPNNPPRLWSVKITVNNKLTHKEVEGEQRYTQDHNWFHFAPLGAVVEVLFDKGPCYAPDGLPTITVGQNNPEMETVQLQKTRECLIGERRQRRQAKARSTQSATASAATGAASGAGAAIRAIGPAGARSGAAIGVREPELDAYDQRIPKSDADLLPSSELLKKELDKEAGLTRAGQFFDTFQYNFAIKWEIYNDNQPLREVLLQFQNDPQNQDLFKPIGSVTTQEFKDSARALFEISDEVRFDNIKKVIKDESLSRNVRGSATVALLNLKLDEQTTNEMRDYYRQQTINFSEIFATSLVALARIGENSDDQQLYAYALNSNFDRRFIAMEALSVAKLIEGPETLPAGAQTLARIATQDEKPEFRAAAVYALRPFVKEEDETAINALFGSLKDPSSEVRLEAVWALSLDEIDDRARVRRVLKRIAKTDPSWVVRRAANLSSTGPARLGNSLRYSDSLNYTSSRP